MKEVDRQSIKSSSTQVKKAQEISAQVDIVDGVNLSQERMKLGVRGVSEEYIETDNDADRIEEEAIAQHLERILDSAQWSDLEEDDDDADADGADGDDEDEEERPSSAISQRSLYEKFKAQLEQRKQEVIERRSRATSMHGSLLNGLDEATSNNASRVSSAITTATADMGFPAEKDIVIKTEIGTSPFLLTPESRDSRKSSISVADHPIVLDYLKTYNYIKDFKDLLAQAFSDKDLTIASDRLSGLKPVEFQKDGSIPQQITSMTSNVELFLKEIGTVITDNLNQEPEATVSSLMTSRLNTGNSRLTTAKSLGVHGVAPPEKAPPAEAPSVPQPYPPLGLPDDDPHELTNEPVIINDIKDGLEFQQLQDNYNKLKEELEIQKDSYEEKLRNNALSMVDLEETIQELQHELAGLGTSPTMKPVSSMSRVSSRIEPEVDPTVIFSRMDTERNQKALKRGINSHKISPDQYNEVVRSMEQYNAVPAKRLVQMVQKYTHHTHMKQIEENVKRSNSIDDEVFSLLEKMEALQNMRAERWGEQMDMLAEERMRLAHLLMESLTKIEEESGIFLIKPILSWKGRGYLPYFQSNLSTYKPPKTFLRPLTREGSAVYGPAPTPTPSHTRRRLNTRQQSGAGDAGMVNDLPMPSRITQSPVPLQGSAINMVGTPPQAMWSMSSSLPNDPPKTSENSEGERLGNRLSNSGITTPKILELEINRMLVGQNTISAPTKAFLSDDRLVNAANSSVRSYMTIARPSAYPIPSLRPTRPNSSGTENSRTGAGSPLARSSSPKLHVRAKSESSLHVSQPLPPIKVPSEGKDGVKDGSISSQKNCEERLSSAKSDHYLTRSATHPSPPHTPPGSSIRQSPPTLPSVDQDSIEREESSPSPGHVTKISMKSPTGVDEEQFLATTSNGER
ncbi:hypothetical protein HOLleu_20588 [Holothuria leucospilota]|uniref:Uncharacterized protein n=1 Tax=Holothuria leucospilota TaxID=206669 RepID=A0A9Q1C0Z3_HOLLE|nr:hypothetical protein HOLleu_20588 [Holothuria leucospilota]